MWYFSFRSSSGNNADITIYAVKTQAKTVTGIKWHRKPSEADKTELESFVLNAMKTHGIRVRGTESIDATDSREKFDSVLKSKLEP